LQQVFAVQVVDVRFNPAKPGKGIHTQHVAVAALWVLVMTCGAVMPTLMQWVRESARTAVAGMYLLQHAHLVDHSILVAAVAFEAIMICGVVPTLV